MIKILFFLGVWSFATVLEAQTIQLSQILANDGIIFPKQVEIFTNQKFKFDKAQANAWPVEVKVYELDYPYQMPPMKTSEEVKRWIESIKPTFKNKSEIPSAEKLSEMAKPAFEARQLLTKYRLKFVPAVVLDGGKSVIYGVSDLSDVLTRYRLYLKKQESNAKN